MKIVSVIKIFNLIILLIFLTTSKLYCKDNKYFLTLRNNEVNVRLGPAFEYPVKFVYKKKYLPLMIIEKSEVWRKVKDLEFNTGWIHISKLSKKKAAIITIERSRLFKKPTFYSRPLATLAKGRLVIIKKCKKKWCKIKNDKYVGLSLKKNLLGNI